MVSYLSEIAAVVWQQGYARGTIHLHLRAIDGRASKPRFVSMLVNKKHRSPGFYTYSNSILTVIASKCYEPYRVFGQVVAQLLLRVVQEAVQPAQSVKV